MRVDPRHRSGIWWEVMAARLRRDAGFQGALDGIACQIIGGGVAASGEQCYGIIASHRGHALEVSAVHGWSIARHQQRASTAVGRVQGCTLNGRGIPEQPLLILVHAADVERVAEAVAEEVEAEDGEADGHAGEDG